MFRLMVIAAILAVAFAAPAPEPKAEPKPKPSFFAAAYSAPIVAAPALAAPAVAYTAPLASYFTPSVYATGYPYGASYPPRLALRPAAVKSKVFKTIAAQATIYYPCLVRNDSLNGLNVNQ
ncbi:hypothetical protein NQ317_005763 [Molorchus minor]|uniref:Uncharacterized protein n=1 Tax=Molorchus minor TaxID=1323400 RepID=A0ABQ9JV82_9CUCU|nr:hypothetical protein NQ317_005763 [Molorchus minor]